MAKGEGRMAQHDIDRTVFVNLGVTIGPGFYGGKKHDTNEDIAEVLASHAAHSDGVLSEIFLILEKYYRTHLGVPLHQLVESPDPNVAGSKGGHTGGTNITFGDCGGCVPNGGGVGYWIYVNGTEQTCVPCP
jgi:hypothetical protein